MNQQKQLFQKQSEKIEAYFDELMKKPSCSPSQLLQSQIDKRIAGVYVFSEIINGKEMFWYVGQSVSVIKRLKEHCGQAQDDKANFAYKLVMDTGKIKLVRYSPTSSKSDVLRHPDYSALFNAATSRIQLMNYRFVEVTNKLERNLLEIYVAVVLQSKYNNFN